MPEPGSPAQHSQTAENWLLGLPGLKIAVPGTVPDLYGLLRSAIQDPDPVLVFEHKALFAVEGTIPDQDPLVPLGVADIARDGDDVTIVATQQMRHRALAAADQLAEEGINAAVIDPRTLVPCDDAAIVASLQTTSRLAVVQEAPADGGWGASLITRMLTGHFELFDAPPLLIAADNTPIPYAGNLEAAWLPSVARIVTEVRKQAQY